MLGDRLKEARLKKGLSVAEVAKAIGKDRTVYFRYESGDIKNFKPGVLMQLSKVLDISLDQLLEG